MGPQLPHKNVPWAPVTTYHFLYHLPVNHSKVWLPSSCTVEQGSPDPSLATPTTMSPVALSQEPVLQALESRLFHCFFLQKMRNYTKSKWEIGTKSPAQGLRSRSLSNPCCLPFKRDKKCVQFWIRLARQPDRPGYPKLDKVFHLFVPYYPQLWKDCCKN